MTDEQTINQESIDLINRLRTENQRLRLERDAWRQAWQMVDQAYVRLDLEQEDMRRAARVKAVQEFAEKVKNYADEWGWLDMACCHVDEVAKEMMGKIL